MRTSMIEKPTPPALTATRVRSCSRFLAAMETMSVPSLPKGRGLAAQGPSKALDGTVCASLSFPFLSDGGPIELSAAHGALGHCDGQRRPAAIGFRLPFGK